MAVRFLERGGPIRPRTPTTWARFDFLSEPGMRAHLRQIVNTFIHVRQPRVLYSVVALDNETEAFWPFSRRRIARHTHTHTHTARAEERFAIENLFHRWNDTIWNFELPRVKHIFEKLFERQMFIWFFSQCCKFDCRRNFSTYFRIRSPSPQFTISVKISDKLYASFFAP